MTIPVHLLATETVTWIQVERPVFDLAGVLISSLSLAGICAGIAFVLGSALGASLIVRARRQNGLGGNALSLHL